MIPNIFSLLGESIVGKHIAKGIIFSNSPKKFHPNGSRIQEKVKGGTLKGVSVGYLVDSWEEVLPNKQSADGRFTGPCSIAKRWTPYEISIVSVPADPTVGVGRSIHGSASDDVYETYVRQLQYNKNFLKQ